MDANMSKQASLLTAGRLAGLNFVASGKVRDIYVIDGDKFLFVTTDRLSAFDVVMKTGIPGKGKILNQITCFWLRWVEEKGICKTHLITDNVDEMPDCVKPHAEFLRDRCMLVRRLQMLPIEAIIRGYITGSGWRDYQKTGQVCGIDLPKGLQHCEQLPNIIFTPSTKAEQGLHDENISEARAREILHDMKDTGESLIEDSEALMDEIVAKSKLVYTSASEFAKEKGIILADTKFEWGLDKTGALVIADEILTPDSSRYWSRKDYKVGQDQDSYDKQIVRNWLRDIKFDKTTPIAIPSDIQMKTQEKYMEIFQILTGVPPRI